MLIPEIFLLTIKYFQVANRRFESNLVFITIQY